MGEMTSSTGAAAVADGKGELDEPTDLEGDKKEDSWGEGATLEAAFESSLLESLKSIVAGRSVCVDSAESGFVAAGVVAVAVVMFELLVVSSSC